ncbi:hypothetical protein JCM8097_006613 [Rhodosporidiobolus ruineniae]
MLDKKRQFSDSSTKKTRFEHREVVEIEAGLDSESLDSTTLNGDGGDPFAAKGDGEGQVNYRSLGWISATVLMCKSSIGIGVLSLPSSFEVLGIIPGVLILIFFASATLWSNYYIGVTKLKHPHVYSMQDVGRLVGGPVVGEIFGAVYFIFSTMVCGSALLGLSTALNAITMHGACTAIFTAALAAFVYPIASLRTLQSIRWVGWIGLIFMIASLFLAAISIAAGGRPSLAPQEGPLDLQVVLFGKPGFAKAMNAVANILWAYTSTCSYISIAAEMKQPRDFKKAVMVSQGFVTAVYLTIGVMVYACAGQYVASPALGTAGVLIKRIAYGLAFPGLIFTAVFFVHLPAKYLHVRILRNSRHLTESTKTHWAVWLSCTAGCLLFSYIVASAIPVFDGLVGLVGACFGSFLSLHAMALAYLSDNRQFWRDAAYRTRKRIAAVSYNILIIVVASFLLVGGTYGSIISIRDSYANSGTRPWSCADNSGSV